MNPHQPLIDAAQLQQRSQHAETRIIDARFDLSDADAGERAFAHAALPSARYLHLDRDLSDHRKPASHGRHPLPDARDLSSRLVALDILPTHDIVIYDAGSGAMAAARAWWLLRALGYPRVAVLDGGFAAWQNADGATAPGARIDFDAASSGGFAQYDTKAWIDTATLRQASQARAVCLIDARAAERYRGEVEPLDPVAGHIPGALNRPFSENLENGRFKSPERLRAEFSSLLGHAAPEQVVLYCGSGVTACHNFLAMEIAGLHGAKLYPPSWSGWIAG